MNDYLEWCEELKDKLRNPEFALTYLNNALDSYDAKIFLKALKDVVEAYGTLAAFAKTADMPRHHIYRLFSKKGIEELEFYFRIFKLLDLKMQLGIKAS